MATGTSRSAWPQSADGVIVLESGQVNIEASKTNAVWDVMTIPFDFIPVKVEISSQTVTETNTITIDVADNEGTPQVLVNDEGLATISAGASTGVVNATIDDYGPFIAGKVLIFRYTSGASDTSVGTRVRVWVRPTNK